MRFWRNAPLSWEKGDQGPVTEADLAVNDLLAGMLRRARPDYGWLSEESPDNAARLDCEHVFIIDPIDGTRAFIAGEKHFAHSLAVARNGEVTAAAVYLPALDRLYTASHDSPALCDGEAVQCSGAVLADIPKILTPKANMAQDYWQGPTPEIQPSFRTSLAFRLCLVAHGSHDGMLTFRDTWEWDIAAGSLIATKAGARVTDRFGRALQFNSPKAQSAGVMAAGPLLHSELSARLKA